MENLRENTSGKGRIRWRRRIPSQIELTSGKKKRTYDVRAALAEALLVFMVSFGAVGGFLDAYGIKYNLLPCTLGILGLCLLLSFIYETRKKCNKCHINKKMKKLHKNYNYDFEENKKLNNGNDWTCSNCGNLNYSFRVMCNRCKIKRDIQTI